MMGKNLKSIGWDLGDPTPAMIARRSAEVRAEWTEEVHAKRAGAGPRRPMVAPLCRLHADLKYSKTLDVF